MAKQAQARRLSVSHVDAKARSRFEAAVKQSMAKQKQDNARKLQEWMKNMAPLDEMF